jgi:hypothetical protein
MVSFTLAQNQAMLRHARQSWAILAASAYARCNRARDATGRNAGTVVVIAIFIAWVIVG